MSDVMTTVVLEAKGLTKRYESGPQQVTVWADLNLQVRAGESVAIVGASGSGKTTLLNALGGLDSVDEGEVIIAGEALARLSEKARTQLRNRDVGFVYQFHHLLPEFTALENVMMPQLLAGIEHGAAMQRASECLQQLGLDHRLEHKPSELSGGERQRTAIARALVNRPKLVLLDEPTGNLDQANAKNVEEAMLALTTDNDTAFVMVTHDPELAERMNRQLKLVNQQLSEA